MKKNLIWKLGLIVFLIIFAVLRLYPPQENLKPGLDLAGGTSLIYDIDTQGLDATERKGIAQRMIPILLKRIDPTNVANIVMRPLGDTRIEIQLPVSSADTIQKRKTFVAALDTLEKENANLLVIKKALSMDPDERQKVFNDFAAGSQQKLDILSNIAEAYDQRKQQQDARDTYAKQMEEVGQKLKAEDIDTDSVRIMASNWLKLKKSDLNKQIEDFLASKTSQSNNELVKNYLNAYKKWADAVNDLAEPETGKHTVYNNAAAKLSELNLNIQYLTDVLDLPEDSMQRTKDLEEIKANFPDRVDKIDNVVTAFDEYRVVGGRLDDPEDLKRMLKGAGVLSFRILPIPGDGKATESQLRGYLEALKLKGPKQASDSKYVWVQIEDLQAWHANGVLGDFGEKTYVLASNQKNESMLQGGKKWKLKKARPTVDQMGRRAIGFTHDEAAAKLFYNVTKNNIGRPLCIILDDIAISAPNIETAIRANGTITGNFTQEEVEDMVNKLNAGSFPARLSDVPISEKSIGPAIGADNRDQGMNAGFIGLAAVAVFMLIYYLLAGSIADIALVMNLIFVLAMMAMFGATFTLPGIAAIILTIGMSVDANVLIFERIREEQQRGSSIRTAIANGYQRAFRTIFDANITTFITALILYMVASEEIKGFAIVLMLGIGSSMFTALFVTRVIFDFLVENRILRDHIVMLRLIKSADINWMGLRKIFFTISIILIAGGMFVFFNRNSDENSKYDIEFTGGTRVEINLKEGTGYDRAMVESIIRSKAAEYDSADLAAAKVYSIGDSGLQFAISTTETNKTSTEITFNDPGQTVESVKAIIENAKKNSSITLLNLSVETADSKTFTISTSQVNKASVKEFLQNTFGDSAEVSDPVVNEIVSRAVREAFEGLLAVREDLGINITSVTKVSEVAVELADYIGGIQLLCQLEKQTTFEDITTRLEDVRFKPDAQDLEWFRYQILDADLSIPDPETVTDSFVYVSIHPEAGYRDLDSDEWDRFVDNEKTKVTKAIQLQTTLARVTQIDPSIGHQAKTRALIAIILSLIAIVGYIWIRFGTARYGLAAIVALVHDVCITLGAVTVCTYIAGTPIGKALLIQDFKINLEMIAAFLTIIGYSLNDTIVVFDRIRENRGKLTNLNPQVITNSINQTLSRTLLTSLTTFLVVLVMYIWGGAGLRGFTFAMLIGIIAGTYSSIAIAAPILLSGKKKTSDQK
ncbi:MAG: protein translocase subunit SecD [Sedimentisphaerales bacterium]|nr:protein translocase subunit SecD [Sedimentisphaerales bacterium]